MGDLIAPRISAEGHNGRETAGRRAAAPPHGPRPKARLCPAVPPWQGTARQAATVRHGPCYLPPGDLSCSALAALLSRVPHAGPSAARCFTHLSCGGSLRDRPSGQHRAGSRNPARTPGQANRSRPRRNPGHRPKHRHPPEPRSRPGRRDRLGRLNSRFRPGGGRAAGAEPAGAVLDAVPGPVQACRLSGIRRPARRPGRAGPEGHHGPFGYDASIWLHHDGLTWPHWLAAAGAGRVVSA